MVAKTLFILFLLHMCRQHYRHNAFIILNQYCENLANDYKCQVFASNHLCFGFLFVSSAEAVMLTG